MPLVSFAFTGCVSGQAPPSPGSTNGSAPFGAGALARAASSGLPTTGVVGRGTGGNGNGAESHCTLPGSGTRVFHARHPAYAIPATMPAPSNRFDPLRIGEFSHVRPVTGRVRWSIQAIGRLFG